MAMARPMPRRDFGPNLTLVPFPRFVSRERQVREELNAWFRLCIGRKRRAHEYRRWALDAEAAGDHHEYQRCRDEANKCWRGARAALEQARRRKDEIDG